MDRFAKLTGRQYDLFEYDGATDAERVIVLMGSGCEAVHETRRFSRCTECESRRAESAAVPAIRCAAFVKCLAHDRKQHCCSGPHERTGRGWRTALSGLRQRSLRSRADGTCPVIGGRYGLSSKEFTPAMVKAVFDNLAQVLPKNHFTIGIDDDLSHTSLALRSGILRLSRTTSSARCSSAWVGRHSRRQQELDQDHRRRDGQLRAGLLRLRFQEIRRDDDLAPAIRSAADSFDLSDFTRRISLPVISRVSSSV